MKIIAAVALLHLVSACAHHDDHVVAVEPIPLATHGDLADFDSSDIVRGRAPMYGNASLENLRVTIDGTLWTEPRLDRLRVATILDAIADAIQTQAEHNPASVSAIRADVAILRSSPLKSARQAAIVRRALDEAIVDLRTNEPKRDYGDVERAIESVALVSPSRPLRRQAVVVREALCAVGNAVETRGDMAALRCVTSQQASLEKNPRKREALAESP